MVSWRDIPSLGGDSMLKAIAGQDYTGEVAAAQKQADAQKEALSQQERLAKEAQDFFKQQSEQGIGYIDEGTGQAASMYSGFGGQAQAQYLAGQEQGVGALGAAQENTLGTLGAGYNQGRGDVSGGYDQARGDLATLQGLQQFGQGATTAIDTPGVTGRSMVANQGDLYAGFEQDPGYQFRQKQGEQAINRMAAAGGGRGGGATMKALADYNQGLASQEYANFANRRQAEAGLQSGLLQSDASRQDAARLAAQQNQYGLAGMGYGAQSQLAGMAAQGGQSLADLGAQYSGQMAGYQNQYGQNLSDLYAQYAGMLGGASMQTGEQMGNLFSQAGANKANVAIGQGANAQSNANNLMGAYQNYANTGGMTQQAQANQNKEIAGLIASFFSDRNLKTDIHDGADDAQEILDALTPFLFRYVSSEYGDGQLLGVMAQDLEKSNVGKQMIIDYPNGKAIDPHKAISALLGIVAHLNNKITKLEKELI